MEERTVAVTVFLTGLIIPIGLGAAVLGILTIVRGMGGLGNPRHDVVELADVARIQARFTIAFI